MSRLEHLMEEECLLILLQNVLNSQKILLKIHKIQSTLIRLGTGGKRVTTTILRFIVDDRC